MYIVDRVALRVVSMCTALLCTRLIIISVCLRTKLVIALFPDLPTTQFFAVCFYRVERGVGMKLREPV